MERMAANTEPEEILPEYSVKDYLLLSETLQKIPKALPGCGFREKKSLAQAYRYIAEMFLL
ncbi:hypothetical protein [Candidatus Electrothrix sp.]|uniref:hypothetical protein n=1 Tax=Candidatus Electrothrix sp. TaxID=2170559 RepID=UPI0040561079